MSNGNIKYPSGDPQNLPAVAVRYLSYLNPLTIHRKSKKAKAFFAKLSSQNRFAIIYRLHQVKREETKKKKTEEYISMLEKGKTIYPQ